MAVRHGYGKIAGTDALVFAYDTGDTRNSYKGEPTTNIIADPLYALGTKTAYYDTNNTGWGTVTRGRIEEVIGPFGKPVQAYSQELISYTSGNRSIEGQPQEVVNNANCLFNLTSGVTYRISVWIKATYTSISQNRLYLSGTAAVGDGENRQVTTEWQRISKTYTPSTSGNYYMRHYDYSSKNTGDKIWYALPQVEVDKGHETQFTTGTRSATQGLVDLTGNSSIDLSNVSFDSNAQMTFDGTNDYVDLSSATSLLNLGSTFSIEGVFKLDNTSQEFGTVFSSLDVATGTQTKGVGFYWKKTSEYGMSANTIRLQLGLSGWAWHIFASNGISISDTNYHHVAVTLTGGNTNYPTIVFYIDGVAQAATKWTAGSIGPINNSSNANSLRLGSIYTASNSSYNNFYSAESLNVVKIYNRVLTASEIKANFNAIKGRFNI